MENNLITEEVYRIKQLMNVSLLTEALMGGIDDVLRKVGISPKSIDNLSKSGVDYAADLTKLSDEFASQGIKTIGDLQQRIATKGGLQLADVTDEMVANYIKNNTDLYQSILKRVSIESAKEVDVILKNLPFSDLFNQSQIDTLRVLLKQPPNTLNSNELLKDITNEIYKIEKSINNLNNKKLPVPESVTDLYENLLSRKIDIENFINREMTINNQSRPLPPTKKPLPTVDSNTDIQSIKNRLILQYPIEFRDFESKLNLLKFNDDVKDRFIVGFKDYHDYTVQEMSNEGLKILENINKEKWDQYPRLKKAFYDARTGKLKIGKTVWTTTISGIIIGGAVILIRGALIAGESAWNILDMIEEKLKEWGIMDTDNEQSESTITEDEKLLIIGRLKRDYPTTFDDNGFEIIRVLLRDPETNQPTSIEFRQPNAIPENGTMTFDKTINKWI